MTPDPLLAAVLANPDDDLPRLVYADWLDENGEPDKATFLRLECEVRAGRTELTELLRIGEALPFDWLAEVSRPRLLATMWIDREQKVSFRYDPDGMLWIGDDGGEENTVPGNWRQIGPLAEIVLNHFDDLKPYASLAGVVRSDSVTYHGRSHDGERLSFRLTPWDVSVAVTPPASPSSPPAASSTGGAAKNTAPGAGG